MFSPSPDPDSTIKRFFNITDQPSSSPMSNFSDSIRVGELSIHLMELNCLIELERRRKLMLNEEVNKICVNLEIFGFEELMSYEKKVMEPSKKLAIQYEYLLSEQEMDYTENYGDDAMMPGFRFHPTDEELVSFYLKRKIQQKPLCIELIKQLDIYKYDPWDLPNFATTGEKEWYFYCPRDRKYRNSARPNRVTGTGFWKATGTDRPIYSSEGTKCIGLKKSLVFYKGRAAKGTKTDWMMHEFRLPSVNDSSMPKRPLEKTIPINEAWAICRIFKKTNTVAHRVISQSWASQFQETTTTESDMFPVSQITYANQLAVSETISCSTTTNTEPSSSSIQFDFPALELDLPNFVFSQEDVPLDSMLLNFSQTPRSNELRVDLPFGFNDEIRSNTDRIIVNDTQEISFPFSLSHVISEDWRLNFLWDSPAFPSEISTGFSTNVRCK